MSWLQQYAIPLALQRDPETRTWAEEVTGNAIIKSVTTTYSAEATDSTILCDATAGAFTVTLPKAANCKGHVLLIKKIDASGNAVTVDGNGAETIQTAANVSLGARWDFRVLQSDGTGYVVWASS